MIESLAVFGRKLGKFVNFATSVMPSTPGGLSLFPPVTQAFKLSKILHIAVTKQMWN